MRARMIGHIDRSITFNIVTYIRKLRGAEIPGKGKLGLKLSKHGPDLPLAFVTYCPLTLHVDSQVWSDGEENEPEARRILAHELGHIFLHDYYAQPYSGERKKWIQREEESAEWQANVFADYFLLLHHHTTVLPPTDLAIRACIPLDIVRRFQDVKPVMAGEACPGCGNFSLVRTGTLLNCQCGIAMEQ
ncbi:MAG: ImmA/IrrE family metallo-endopeptidase [Methylobacteriaceae bacterium]|nr:ImmA/IrrE family metallo-endopeptidase [Methylobacteriaceae bacterium]